MGYPAPSTAEDIPEDIRIKSLLKNKPILILDMVNESSEKDTDYLSKEFPFLIKNSLLIQRKYTFISRAEIQKVIKEKKIKLWTLQKRETAVDIGKAVGADVVIYGFYNVQDYKLTATFKIAKVEGMGASSYEGEGDYNLDLMVEFVERFVEDQHHRLDRTLGLKEKKYLKKEEKPTEKKKEEKPVEKEKPAKKGKKHFPMIGIKGGYFLIFGDLGDSAEFNLPYGSLFWRDDLSSQSLLYEIEIGFFSSKGTGSPKGGEITGHYLPITFSFVYPIELTSWLSLSPKAGLGYMLAFTNTELQGNLTSSFLVGKPSLEFAFHVSDHFSILLEDSLLIGYEATDGGISFFNLINLGIGYSF